MLWRARLPSEGCWVHLSAPELSERVRGRVGGGNASSRFEVENTHTHTHAGVVGGLLKPQQLSGEVRWEMDTSNNFLVFPVIAGAKRLLQLPGDCGREKVEMKNV